MLVKIQRLYLLLIYVYNLYKISNIAPSITKNLDSALTLNVGDKKTISFSANGTNNVYTWYFSKDGKSKTTLIGNSNTPSIDITATKDMNGKYLICTIKNDGNNEIMTSALKLTVNEPKKEEEQKEEVKEEVKEEIEQDKEKEDIEDEDEKEEDIEVTIPEDEINKPTEEPKLNNDFKNKLSIIFASIMGVSLVGIILNLLSRKKKGM